MNATPAPLKWRFTDAAYALRLTPVTGGSPARSSDEQCDRAFANHLAAGQFDDALRFLAYGLPVREAIAWGCLCVERARGDRLEVGEVALLAAAMRWAMDPSGEHGQAAESAARLAASDSPATMLALAAAWSREGREREPNCIANLTDPAVVPLMVTNAIFAALPVDDRERAANDFIALGIDVLSESAPMHEILSI